MNTPTTLRFSKPFTREQLETYLAVLGDLTGCLEYPDASIPESLFWKAAFLAKHDLGLSWRRLFELPWRAIQPDGRIAIDFRLSREAQFAIADICSPARPLAFGLPEDFNPAIRLRLIRQFAAFETGGEA